MRLRLGVLLLALTACTGGGGSAPQDAGRRGDATVPAGDAASSADAPSTTLPDGCVLYDATWLDDDVVQPGADLVLALKCRHCHDDDLSGNPGGVQTEAGFAYPPNITPDPTTGIGCWTDEQIERAFLDGVDDQGQPLCPSMPRFAEAGVDALAAQEILEYLRSVPPKLGTVPDTTCADAAAE